MSNFEPNKRHLRELLIYFFNLKKSAAEAHRLLVEAYDEAALSERSCREWFQKFKNGDFDVEDKERSGRPKVYEDTELEALLEEDLCQTQKELALTLGVTQQAISHRLKSGSKTIGKQTENVDSLKKKLAKLEKQVIDLTKKHVEGSKKPDHVVYGQKPLHRTPKATSAIFGKSGCSCKSVRSCSSQICSCVKNSNKCGLSCKCDNEMCQNQARPVQTWKPTGCSCKGNCSSKMCGCVKNSNSCDPSCKCDEQICENNRLCYRDRDMY